MRRRTLCFSIVVILVGLAQAAAGAGAPEPEPTVPALPAPPSACATRIAQLDSQDLRYLVVTLPDPVASEFGREFDMFLAGTRRALEVSGHHQTRHCLPWTEAFDDDGSLTEPEGFDFDRYGTAIFEGAKKTWVVYIVGETPGQGIRRKAMLRALDSICGPFDNPTEARCPDEIKVLGPTFSGSVPSLGETLLEWSESRLGAGEAASALWPRIAVLSGTATRSNNGDIIEEASGKLKLRYDSTATSTALLGRAMWDKVVPERLGVKSGAQLNGQAVAILQEASPYAAEFSELGFQVFQFPMNVSRSIEEYEQYRNEEQSDGSDLAVELPTRTLPLRLGRKRLIPDNIPSFDVGTTSTVDLMLSSIVQRIAQSRIEIVAIAATSTTDKIFLSHYLRQRAPNVRLVTFEGDLLLAHPEIAESTRGMLVVSSHPMVEPAPDTAAGPSDRGAKREKGQFIHHFGSDGHQGVFRAARALLSSDDNTQAALVTGPREVWVGVVGNGAIVPVERFLESDLPDLSAKNGATAGNNDSMEQNVGAGRRRTYRESLTEASSGWKPPRGWFLVFLFMSFGVSLLLYFTIRRIVRGGTTTGIGMKDLLVEASKPLQTRRLAFITVLATSVTAGYPMAIVPYLHYVGTHFGSALAGAVGLLLTLTLFLLSLYLLLALILRTGRDWKADESRRRERLYLLAPLAAAIPAAVLAGFVLIKAVTSGMDPLLMDRCVRIGSGVNPLLPAMLAAALIVGWLSLCLVRFDAVFRIPGLSEAHLPPSRRTRKPQGVPQSIAEQIDSVRQAVLPGGFGVRHWTVDVGLFTACFAMPVLYLTVYNGVSLRLVRGIEGVGFDRIMTILFVSGLCMAITAGITARRVWNALRTFLDLLDEACDVGAGDEAAKSAPEGWFRKERHRLRRRSRVIAARNGAWKKLTDEKPPGNRSTNAERAALERRCANRWFLLAKRLEADTAGLSVETWAAGRDDWNFFLWQCAVVVGAVLRQLLNLVGFFTVGLLTLMAVVTIYSFEPHSVLTLTVGLLMALGAIFSVVMILQMEKNETLSRISGFSAGFTWHRQFVGRIGLFAGVPLFGLLATRFPVVGDLVASWLKPILKALI